MTFGIKYDRIFLRVMRKHAIYLTEGILMISESDKSRMMVGYKQTLKAINEGKAERVYLAEECDDKIRLSVEAAADQMNTQLMYVKPMRELGNMCGIEVGASCAVILK